MIDKNICNQENNYLDEERFPDWARNIAFNVLTHISNNNIDFLKQINISSALSEKFLKIDLNLYPMKIGAPPLDAKDKFYNLKLLDGSGWWVACPFFDEDGNQTDLELQMHIYGNENNYKIEINDILVP